MIFEDAGWSTMSQSASCYQPVDMDESGIEDPDNFHHPEKKRRLSADQVQLLERSFEMENKLEPERKVQLARDLGLQPRQVAVWFQNRRARWKTKQLEKDYEALKRGYDSLKLDYGKLLEETEELKAEVVVLAKKLRCEEESSGEDPGGQQLAQTAADSSAAFSEAKDPENAGAGNSGVLDCSGSPHGSDGGRVCRSPVVFGAATSSTPFEQEYSDLSHGEDAEEMYRSSWLWPSY